MALNPEPGPRLGAKPGPKTGPKPGTARRRAGRALLACAALAWLAPQGRAAGVVPLTWDAERRHASDATVAAGRFVEVCGPLPAGSRVRWTFDAAAPLDFNIHFHVGRQVHYPVQRRQVGRAAGVLQAKSEQDYCWMWTNKSDRDVPLAIRLENLAPAKEGPRRP